MKRPYSFDQAQKDALKNGPKPTPFVPGDDHSIDWVWKIMMENRFDQVEVQKEKNDGIPGKMVASFKIEGMEPSAEDQELHQEYIAGRATLDDLKNHAIAFALEQSALEHSPNNSSRAQEMLAAGHWVTYYDDNLVPDVILREWPDGRMEIVEPDGKGNVVVVKELPSKMELFKRRDALRSAKANVQLSGGYPSKQAMDRMEEYATSKLTWNEFFKDTPLGPDAKL